MNIAIGRHERRLICQRILSDVGGWKNWCARWGMSYSGKASVSLFSPTAGRAPCPSTKYMRGSRLPAGDANAGGSVKAYVNYFLTHRFIRNQVTNILRRHKIDLIHVHCVSSNGYYALLARKELGLPLVVTTHGERTMDATHIYERSAFLNRVLRDLLGEADHITAVSRHTLDDMETYWGSHSDKGPVLFITVLTWVISKAGRRSPPVRLILWDRTARDAEGF